MVPAEAADVTGKSTQLNTPALVSNVIAPNSRLSRTVCPVATNPPEKVDVAVVEVAWKYSATTGPTTESFAYGLVVPMPTLPALVMVSACVPAPAAEVKKPRLLALSLFKEKVEVPTFKVPAQSAFQREPVAPKS